MSDAERAAYVEAASKAIGLAIADDYRAGVASYVALAESMAESVNAFSLAPSDEPAPQFVPRARPSASSDA